MRHPHCGSVPGTRSPESKATTIRRLSLLLSLVLAVSLAACGTWDPTASDEPEATRTTPIDEGDTADASATMTVGDGTFNFSLTDCYADDDGIRFTGRSPDGDMISGEYDPEAPEDAAVVVTNSDGVEVFTSDASSGGPAPEFQMTEDGFTAVGAFVADTDEELEGSLTGTC